jgi:hypothetical protein
MQVKVYDLQAQLTASNKVILLFYRPFEREVRQARSLFAKAGAAALQSGFDVSFNLLKRSLVKAGWIFRVNDRRLRDDIPNIQSA